MNESEFAFRIRQALNEGAERVDYRTVFRLEQARAKALSRQRHPGPATVRLPALQLANAGLSAGETEGGWWPWLRGAGLVAPLVTLAIGFVVISDWQHKRELDQLAALDFAVLLDDGPIDAYADKSFGILLQRQLRTH